MGAQRIYVEITINADCDRVWELTQNTDLHPRWDLRFSTITPSGSLPSGGYRFDYARRVFWHTIVGTGTTIGELTRPDGTRTSALRFTTTDRVSPIGEGRGYWRYAPGPDGTTFATGFDYEPGWGGFIDRVVMRRLIGWMTAWSFDRLRIWVESGIEPERWSLASVFAFWKPDRPRASRCRRQLHDLRASTKAPQTLNILEAP